VYDKDPERLKTLKEEYESIGFTAKINGDRLTVYTLKPVEGRAKKRQQSQDRKRFKDDDE
jgi:hypothetical protein